MKMRILLCMMFIAVVTGQWPFDHSGDWYDYGSHEWDYEYGSMENDECTQVRAMNEVRWITSHSSYGTDHYERETDICWVITAPEGHRLKLWTGEDFHLENQHSCEFDRLDITCDENGRASSIGRYCGRRGISEDSPVFSSSESVRVRFVTDGSVQKSGFQLFFSTADINDAGDGNCRPGPPQVHECQEISVWANYREAVTSHETWPLGHYARHVDKCWTVTAPEGYVVKMWTSHTFHLEGPEGKCHFDKLLITCGTQGEDGYIGRYCGDKGIHSDKPVYSSSESVRIRFHTDGSNQQRGFKLYLEAVNPADERNWYGGDCKDELPDKKYRHDDEDDSEEVAHVIGVIVGITVSVIVFICIIAGVTICICVGVISSRRQGGYVHNYPLQTYPTTYPQTVIPSQMTTQPAAQQPTQPAAQYLPTVSGAQFQGPPAYTNAVYSEEKSAPPPEYEATYHEIK